MTTDSNQSSASLKGGGVPLADVVAFLDHLLDLQSYPDESLNGLQIETNQEITKVGAAVDAGEAVFTDAARNRVDLLLVHHGLLWSNQQQIRGPFGRKVGELFHSGINLYCAHLPLDAHPEFGNNAILAKMLNLEALRPALKYRGKEIGTIGTNSGKLTVQQMAERLKPLGGYGPGQHEVLILPFGPDVPQQTAVLTGAGCSAIADAAAEGFDTLITGEPRQNAYHQCKELGINLICAGHYATETVGVRALSQIVAGRFKIGQIFLDHPTGI